MAYRGWAGVFAAVCFLASGRCAAQSDPIFSDGFEQRCTVYSQCAGGSVCAAGYCVAPGSIGFGGACSANRDCTTGLACLAGACWPAGGGGAGESCVSGADCSADLACSLYGLGGTCTAGGSSDVGQICTAANDCVAGLACSTAGICLRSTDAYPPSPGVTCAPDVNPFRVFFEVPRPGAPPADFYRLPFPNDARINADGTLDLSDFPRLGNSVLGFDIADRYADALTTEFDGFSSVTGVTFRFSNQLDFATTGAASVHFVDITNPGQPGFGDDHLRGWGYDPGLHRYVCQNALTVSPGPADPLRPGGKYAVYLTTDIHSATGAPPVQDPDLAAVLAGTTPSDPALARTWTKYANFRSYLQANSLSPVSIAGASVITIEDPAKKMLALKDAVEAQSLPAISELTLCNGATASPCAIAGDSTRVCGNSSGNFWEIHGRLSIPNFQQGTPPYEFPDNGGAIAFDPLGVPVQTGTLNVCFALTVPKSPKPGSGWPLVMHAHGTGGSFRSAIDSGIATALAGGSAPMATLTFEGIAHGERRGASTREPDGLVFNVINPRAARDNHLQGAVDVIQALRVAQGTSFSISGPGAVSFDPSRTYFIGDGQGSDVGIPAIAVSNRAPAVVLAGAGSYLSESILTRTSPVSASAALAYLINEPVSDPSHPILSLWQTYFNVMDPINYDRLVLGEPPSGVVSKHVYLPWGTGDTYTPNPVVDITAQAMGLGQGSPVLQTIFGLPQLSRPVSLNAVGGDGISRTAVIFQYAPFGYDGHFVFTANAAAVSDWVSFLVSHAQTGTPTVP